MKRRCFVVLSRASSRAGIHEHAFVSSVCFTAEKNDCKHIRVVPSQILVLSDFHSS